MLDLKLDNIIFSIGDMSILDKYAHDIKDAPEMDKNYGDRTIYRTRDLIAMRKLGPPILTDLGEARLRTDPRVGIIMPYQYRAPEVLLEIPWDEKVDIWSIGMIVKSLSVPLVCNWTNEAVRCGIYSKIRPCSSPSTRIFNPQLRFTSPN